MAAGRAEGEASSGVGGQHGASSGRPIHFLMFAPGPAGRRSGRVYLAPQLFSLLRASFSGRLRASQAREREGGGVHSSFSPSIRPVKAWLSVLSMGENALYPPGNEVLQASSGNQGLLWPPALAKSPPSPQNPRRRTGSTGAGRWRKGGGHQGD